MFESLSDRLTGALAGLRGKGRLTDADIDATTREIRLALLEADVSLPVVREFVALLRQVLPDCDARDLYWSYHFLSGALTLTFAETGRIDNLSGGVCKSSDLDSVHERLVPFVAAGFRALCAGGAGAARRAGRKGKA